MVKQTPYGPTWRNDAQMLIDENKTKTIIFWTEHVLVLSIGTSIIFALITVLGVIYWCSRYQRSSKKNQCEPSELTPFSSVHHAQSKSKETILYPISPKIPTSIMEESYSSSDRETVKPVRKKNLLQSYKFWSTSTSLLFKRRRGSNNSLTISVTPIQLRLNSPPTDSPSDEYLQTATRQLTIDELHQHAQDTRALYQEFWSIPTNHLEKLRIYGAGIKNRYGTIIANEHSRVKLPELSGDSISSYINANYIHGWCNGERAFIATQGPLSNTIIDFYRMIWQEHVPVIVMITRLIEKNKTKCERYVPDAQSEQYGPFHVEVKSTLYRTDYEVRRLTIKYENEQRDIDHFWYTAWPDQSCPDVTKPLIELVQNVENSRKELSRINQNSGSVVVHCSAGIGRTGCFIALSNGIKQLDTEHVVDVVRILCNLRRDRGGMIQTHDQYQFLYQALSDYARTLK
ncbi:unnamed protein product [Adineta ricciae]|uniref:protein-tyrosine-phosphatase n=1 Tax=Adineta ricciae TaxID=249248 RepID=A0A814FQN4_ADIRI|nr:unnamed protein product [Adineta ricciae]